MGACVSWRQSRRLPTIMVACAVCHSGEVFIQQRPEGKPSAGSWESPGGIRDGNWNQSLASCHDHYPTRLERTAMQVTQPLGPPNLCRNGACGELVEICCRFQHYCCGCASGNLGLRAGEPALRITLALRRRRRVVGRVLLCHKARPPTCVVTYIIDHLMNDLGKVSPSTRWACILIRSGVQLE